MESERNTLIEIDQNQHQHQNIFKLKRTIKSYTIERKIEVIELLRNVYAGNKSKCSKALDISRATLNEWIKDESKFLEVRERNDLAIRKTRKIVNQELRKTRGKYQELEEELFRWWEDVIKDSGLSIDCDRFAAKAKSLFVQVYPDRDLNSFKFSKGWFAKFVRRFGLSYRSATSVGQSIPVDADIKISNYFDYFDK